MLLKHEIIGFMPSFNLYTQGYPFLETIYSALNVCDRLYITDGSTDQTNGILKRISKNKRIILYNDEWKFNSANTKKGHIISEMSNRLLKRVSKDEDQSSYVFYIQANEVIHENTYEFLKSVPEVYSKYKACMLCYRNIYGDVISSTQYRMRFAPLRSNPFVFSDGWTMSIKQRSPKWFAQYAALSAYYLLTKASFYDGIWSNWEDYAFLYSSEPICRYTRIFKDNVREKIKTHARMFRNYDFKTVLNDSGNFRTWAELYKSEMSGDTYENKKRISAKEHPKIMRPLLNKSRYEVRENLIEAILHL
jgi:hypothetical protein